MRDKLAEPRATVLYRAGNPATVLKSDSISMTRTSLSVGAQRSNLLANIFRYEVSLSEISSHLANCLGEMRAEHDTERACASLSSRGDGLHLKI